MSQVTWKPTLSAQKKGSGAGLETMLTPQNDASWIPTEYQQIPLKTFLIKKGLGVQLLMFYLFLPLHKASEAYC